MSELSQTQAELLVMASSLQMVALLYGQENRYAKAEPLLRRALAVREQTLGHDHVGLLQGLEQYAALLRKMDRETDATQVEARARQIRAASRRRATSPPADPC